MTVTVFIAEPKNDFSRHRLTVNGLQTQVICHHLIETERHTLSGDIFLGRSLAQSPLIAYQKTFRSFLKSRSHQNDSLNGPLKMTVWPRLRTKPFWKSLAVWWFLCEKVSFTGTKGQPVGEFVLLHRWHTSFSNFSAHPFHSAIVSFSFHYSRQPNVKLAYQSFDDSNLGMITFAGVFLKNYSFFDSFDNAPWCDK